LKTIKNLGISDFAQVSKFILEEKKEFDKFVKLGWSMTNIQNHLKKNNNFSLGCIYKNKIYGILLGEKIINNSHFDLEIHIIFVSQNDRRKNIGSKILNFVEKNKNLNNITKIYLEVSEDNINAIKFYEKNNFVFFKFRHNYYIGNKSINAKCYSKII